MDQRDLRKQIKVNQIAVKMKKKKKKEGIKMLYTQNDDMMINNNGKADSRLYMTEWGSIAFLFESLNFKMGIRPETL